MCFCLSLEIGFLLASAPVIPHNEKMMNKILLKALRCFIMSDKLLCRKNSDKKRLSLYHHIKNILIRSWEYSWFKQNLAVIFYFEQWDGEIFDHDGSNVQSDVKSVKMISVGWIRHNEAESAWLPDCFLSSYEVIGGEIRSLLPYWAHHLTPRPSRCLGD